MAAITTAGKVTCKQGTEAVTVREFGNGGKIAKFSMVDQEYFYSKDEEKRRWRWWRGISVLIEWGNPFTERP